MSEKASDIYALYKVPRGKFVRFGKTMTTLHAGLYQYHYRVKLKEVKK